MLPKLNKGMQNILLLSFLSVQTDQKHQWVFWLSLHGSGWLKDRIWWELITGLVLVLLLPFAESSAPWSHDGWRLQAFRALTAALPTSGRNRVTSAWHQHGVGGKGGEQGLRLSGEGVEGWLRGCGWRSLFRFRLIHYDCDMRDCEYPPPSLPAGPPWL